MKLHDNPTGSLNVRHIQNTKDIQSDLWTSSVTKLKRTFLKANEYRDIVVRCIYAFHVLRMRLRSGGSLEILQINCVLCSHGYAGAVEDEEPPPAPPPPPPEANAIVVAEPPAEVDAAAKPKVNAKAKTKTKMRPRPKSVVANKLLPTKECSLIVNNMLETMVGIVLSDCIPQTPLRWLSEGEECVPLLDEPHLNDTTGIRHFFWYLSHVFYGLKCKPHHV